MFAAVADVVQLGLVLLDLGVVIDDILLVKLDGTEVLRDQLVDVRDLAFDGSHVTLEGLDFRGQFAAELDDLLDLVVRFLQGVEGLELILDIGLGVGEGLLEGYEGFPLIDGSFDFLDLRCRHISSINIESGYCLSAYY